MPVQMKMIQLKDLILTMSESEIAELAISDVCDGEVVHAILLEYLLRYTYVYGESETAQKQYFIFQKYQKWLLYRYPDIVRSIQALQSEYDPSADYSMTESELRLENDGDKTVTTKNKYDYTSTETANNPTTSRYTTTYDSTADRLESKSVSSGSTETHVVAANDEVNKKTAITSHTAASMTVDDQTYSADYIHNVKKSRTGNIHKSPAETIADTVALYRNSVLHRFLEEFINTYTFYTGPAEEGRCFL